MKYIKLLICYYMYMQITLCDSLKANVKTKNYKRELSLDNKASNISLLSEHHVESFKDCPIKCAGLCTCFGFNSQLKKCRIHQSCYPCDMNTIEAGWIYYSSDGMLSFIIVNLSLNVLLAIYIDCKLKKA
jgi:hypothetical protein